MVHRKAKPQGTLLEEFKEHVTKNLQPGHFIDDVLIPMAKVYEEIIDQNYASTTAAELVNEHLKWLNRLEFNDWLPPALAFAVRWRSQPEFMGKFFGDLERLAYSLLIRKAGINDRIERFSRLTGAIERNEDLFSANSALQLSGSEQYEAYSVLSGSIYETLAARARSTVLLRLDALLSGGGATYDYPTITVEHVLPQFPRQDSEWLAWFPDAEKRDACVHTLGNLALLTRKKNSAASNYDFAYKKNAYFTRSGVSPFPLTTQVLQYPQWTPEIVTNRQKDLLSILEQHWRLQGRKTAIGKEEATTANTTGRALNKKWGVNAQHALYREDGTWYHVLERFPGALFDAHGYIMFDTEEDYKNCPGISIGKELSVAAGIANLPGYVRVT